MAPEVLQIVVGQHCVYDKHCDVYSFGVLVWEIIHCQTPYGNSRLDQVSIFFFFYPPLSFFPMSEFSRIWFDLYSFDGKYGVVLTCRLPKLSGLF